jgi:hypothetical protein
MESHFDPISCIPNPVQLIIFGYVYPRDIQDLLRSIPKDNYNDVIPFVISKFRLSKKDCMKYDNLLFTCMCELSNIYMMNYLYDLLKFTESERELYVGDIFGLLCKTNKPDAANWVWNKFNMTDSEELRVLRICESCIRNKYLDVIKLLCSKLNEFKRLLSSGSWFANICAYGGLEMVKWVYTEFKLTREKCMLDDNCAFRNACWNGELEVAKWLYTEFKMTREECMMKNNDAFRFACENIYPGSYLNAEKNPYLNTARWLCSELKLTKEECGRYFEKIS